MAATRLDVRTADGMMDVYLHRPAGAAAAPTVILYPDAFGVRPSIHAMADRLATHGYLVVTPNVFYRSGTFAPFDFATTFSNPAERARLGAIMAQANPAAVMGDLDALLAALASDAGARVAQVGIVGYCMGGRLAVIAAGTFPTRVAAVASIHGGRLTEDEPTSPHLLAGKIQAQLYFGVADNDQSCTPESQARLRAALDEAKVRYQMEVYPGALHGFAVPDMPVYQEAAAEKHWERVVALFGEALPRG